MSSWTGIITWSNDVTPFYRIDRKQTVTDLQYSLQAAEFLHVSYFYERPQTHEAIVDCEVDLVSYTDIFVLSHEQFLFSWSFPRFL